MKSNYKKIGELIRLIDNRNAGLKVKQLLGLSISKQFIASVANTIGTDMENYKIIRRGQFACSTMQVRRDKKVPVALLDEIDEAIISQAYPVFEVVDTKILLPEYLMMWFRRKEFDREACFYAIGGVRGTLEWEDFCEMKLPVPHIDKQKEIVKEYTSITNRIKFNDELIQKLEEFALTIYRHWFIDFEFPDENGLPYKSGGGDMVESSLGEIPKDWTVGNLSDISHILMGQSPDSSTYNAAKNGIAFFQGRTDFGFRFPIATTYTPHPKRTTKKGAILISVRAPVGDLNIAIENCGIGRGVASIRSKLKCNSHLFYLLKNAKNYFGISNDTGTVFGSLCKNELHSVKISFNKVIIKKFERKIARLDNKILFLSKENEMLFRLNGLLLSKMAKMED